MPRYWITYFEIAVGIEQKIGRFEITVQNVGRMEGFEGSEGLIDEVLTVVVRQLLRAYHTMHVRLHEFLCSIHVSSMVNRCSRWWSSSRLTCIRYTSLKASILWGRRMSRMEMIFSWLKCRKSLISRSVRRANMEWSKGVIRFMATLRWDGRWVAELHGMIMYGRRVCVAGKYAPYYSISSFT